MTLTAKLIAAGLAVAFAGWVASALIDYGVNKERMRQMLAQSRAEQGAAQATVPLDKCPPGKWNRETGRCEQ